MGSATSSHERIHNDDEGEEEEEEEDNNDDEEEEDEDDGEKRGEAPQPSKMKVLQQEPEILTCHASASPLSPQLSTVGTPRLFGAGPAIKVWDPCNVLAPPPPPSPGAAFGDRFADGFGDAGDRVTEVFLISHGECGLGLRPDLVGGRWPAAGLTANGERQARALAVFLNSQGVRFNAVYSSPLDRARATAAFVCRELNFSEEQIQSSDALIEMSNGQWEGCHCSEIYTPELLNLIDRTQPDFSAPSGESLRQVEYRMIEFLNRTVLRMPDKLGTTYMLIHQNENKGFSRHSSANSVEDPNRPILPHSDPLNRHMRQGITRKKSGKSRLQFVTSVDNETEDEFSPREGNHLQETSGRHPASTIGIFTHAIPVKCLLTGLLESSPALSARICIDDSSTTVLHHSLRTGWQIKRLNNTAHVRLL